MTVKKNTKLHKELKNKVILITGGAGSIGSALAKEILKYPVNTVRVLDIDENALFQLKRELNHPKLRTLLGNILDKERLEMAGNKVDILIHAAAIKNVEISEFNPIETIETNTNGMINLIKWTMKSKPQKFLNISTDKAADASTLYGTTKRLTEILVNWSGIHIQSTKWASIRFGNVIETRGNVFEIWEKELEQKKPLSITDPKMKRFFFHKHEAIDFILQTLLLANKGQIFIPKMKSFKIIELANRYSKKHKIIGKRPGEKLDEILMSNEEKQRAQEKRNMWIINPN